MAAIRIESDPAVSATGLDVLIAEAWEESGRHGPAPPGWRPFDAARAEGIAIRDAGRLVAYAAVRPSEGMDSVDFFFVRRGSRKAEALRTLIEQCAGRLKETGATRIIYVGFGWWRAGFPASFARAFGRAGFGRFDGVFLARPIEPGGPPPGPAPRGYAIDPWRDEWFGPVCDCMLVSPEPEALYWDMDLCRRSILNASHAGAAPAAGGPDPLFPAGYGQVAFLEGRPPPAGPVAGFALATPLGYVNHVYSHPDHRGRGLATALLTRLIGAIARRRLPRATILTHDTNPGAIALYERLGFAVDFRYPQFFLKW